MALAPLDVLAGVVALFTGQPRGLDTLAVQAGRRGVFMPPRLASHASPPGFVNALPRAVASPVPKVAVDRSQGGKSEDSRRHAQPLRVI